MMTTLQRTAVLFEKTLQTDPTKTTDITGELYAGRTLKRTGVYQVPEQEKTHTETKEEESLRSTKIFADRRETIHTLTVGLIIAVGRLLAVRIVVRTQTSIVTSKHKSKSFIIPSAVYSIFEAHHALDNIKHAVKNGLILGKGRVFNHTLRTKERPLRGIAHANIVIEGKMTGTGIFAYQDKVERFTSLIIEHARSQKGNIRRIKANVVKTKKMEKKSKRETHIVQEESNVEAEIVLELETLTRNKRRGEDSEERTLRKITPVFHSPNYLR
jgi:hypothetical protein